MTKFKMVYELKRPGIVVEGPPPTVRFESLDLALKDFPMRVMFDNTMFRLKYLSMSLFLV